MKTDTLRLLMPQWQGGNNAAYPLGAKLLAWLAPASDAPLVEVPVKPIEDSGRLQEKGVVERKALIKQLKAARNIIEACEPQRLVVFGGDCLVSQAPLAYLNERYDGDLGVLWIDAHPDVSTPQSFWQAHAMVLGNLLGEGDDDFAAEVKVPLKPQNIMFAGLQPTLEQETEVIERLGLRRAGPEELADDSRPVLDWIRDRGIKRLAIHLDLDVLDYGLFRSLLFADPEPDPNTFTDFTTGEMTFPQLSRLLGDVFVATEVVGLTLAEHMPWDAINLEKMLAKLPLLSPTGPVGRDLRPATLQLLFPQWQGGGSNPLYPLGARLMSWLAPDNDFPKAEVPVAPYQEGSLRVENGITERSAILRQARAARQIIEAHSPERLVVFGGDCMVAQAPLSYLNEQYDGELGLLWIDRHPDMKSPAEAVNAHAMVLRSLLGEGDPELAELVRRPFQPARVMFAGLGSLAPAEEEVLTRLSLRRAGDLALNSDPVTKWIEENKIRHLAIHLDVDVLDPRLFRSLQSGNPEAGPEAVFRTGQMTFPQLTRLVTDVSGRVEVVGLVLAEHMPWDSYNLQKLLTGLPILTGH